MRMLAVAFLGLLLSSCALTGPGGDRWARAIFSPSEAAKAAVCERAYQLGSTESGFAEVLKTPVYQVASKRGEVKLVNGLGPIRLLCGFAGTIRTRVPRVAELGEYSTSILIDDAELDRKTAKVRVELEGEKGEALGSISPNGQSQEDKRTWFQYSKLGPVDIAKLDQAAAFTVVIERGLDEERYRVTPTDYPGINSIPQQRGTYGY